MKTRELAVPTKMGFKEIMTLHGFNGFIPTHKIINKRVPGIGATYNEIMSERHSIIIVPFTAIIEVKKLKHGDNLCVIYGEYAPETAVVDILAYLRNDSIPWKKIMTTPESFWKVKLALLEHNPSYIKEFFCLIDECDVLVHDAIFRKDMLQIMPDFFSFKSKSMISATPLPPSDPRFVAEEFEYLTLEPKYLIKPKLNLIVTNNINASIRERIDFLNKKDDKPILIFTNCKRTIAYLAKLEHIKDNYKVFCNESLDNKFFKPHGIQNVSESVGSQEYAKYNFFTSRFFSGVDFFLSKKTKPHVIMVSNVTQAPHSMISPQVSAIQIYGRSRNGISSTTHITNLLKGINYLDKYDIIKNIDKRIYHLKELNRIRSKSFDKTTIKVLNDIADKDDANVIFQKDKTINPYFRDNFLYIQITNNLYSNEQALLNEYKEGNFFKPTLNSVYKPLTEDDLNKLKRLKHRRKSEEILVQLEQLVNRYGLFNLSKDYEDYYSHLNILAKEDKLIHEGFFTLGSEMISKLKFNRKKIRSAIFDTRKGDKKNYVRMIDEIILAFEPYLSYSARIPLYIDVIEKELDAIYTKFNYESKPGKLAKASGTDIEDYFDFKRINGKKKVDGIYKTYYILYKPKFKLSDEAARLR